jgi:elongation factor 2
MPHFSVDDMQKIMDFPDKIRNMSVIAHVDHGKTTLTDSLLQYAGIISSKAQGDARGMDTRADEQERGVTIKSTGVSLYFEHGPEKDGHLINLIDSPGHVDFSSEVTAALRVTDGAVVVVDCVSGCAVQTETVLRQALADRVKPVLFVNKIDRCITELSMSSDEMYETFRRAIENVNVIISTYNDELMGDVQVYPEKGTVSFGSGLHGWAFNLEFFANLYAGKTGAGVDKWMNNLWGDRFYNEQTKKWNSGGGGGGSRGFCKYIIEPIVNLVLAILNDDKPTYQKMFEKLGIVLKGDDKALQGKYLMRKAMHTWLHAAHTLLDMIVLHLPSPAVAQKYRVHNLYQGPMDDKTATAIKNCDPNGPLMVFISKMVPTADKGRFYAFGRVFSGTISSGKAVRIQGPNYKPGSNEDLTLKNVQRTVLMMGKTAEAISSVPAGNTVACVGLDQSILKTATICDDPESHNIVQMKYSVSPVVRCAVKPKDPKDLPKINEGMKKLSRSDPLVVTEINADTGEHIIACCGELHMEICLKDLQDDFLGPNVPLIISPPVVPYRETVTMEPEVNCLAKSPNNHNRLYMVAAPLEEQFALDIEREVIIPDDDLVKRTRQIVDSYGWAKATAQKIWAFAPENNGPNLMVDETQGIQYLNEIREHVNGGFQYYTRKSVMCDEQMRAVRFNLRDVTLHPDSIHRGANQIMPATRKVMFACMLNSQPTLQEPVFMVTIQCPREQCSGVYMTLSNRRGQICDENPVPGSPLTEMKAFLPVSESFGFTAALRANTSGQAFETLVFDHWENLEGSAMTLDSQTQKLVMAIRERKGLKAEMPKASDYWDRL